MAVPNSYFHLSLVKDSNSLFLSNALNDIYLFISKPAIRKMWNKQEEDVLFFQKLMLYGVSFILIIKFITFHKTCKVLLLFSVFMYCHRWFLTCSWQTILWCWHEKYQVVWYSPGNYAYNLSKTHHND